MPQTSTRLRPSSPRLRKFSELCPHPRFLDSDCTLYLPTSCAIARISHLNSLGLSHEVLFELLHGRFELLSVSLGLTKEDVDAFFSNLSYRSHRVDWCGFR